MNLFDSGRVPATLTHTLRMKRETKQAADRLRDPLGRVLLIGAILLSGWVMFCTIHQTIQTFAKVREALNAD